MDIPDKTKEKPQAKKLTIKKPNKHIGSEELAATLSDNDKNGRINMDIGLSRKKKLKMEAINRDTTMTKLLINYIDSELGI